MDLFVWDRHFNTGLPALDEQHRALVVLFNELHSTLFDLSLPSDRRARVLRRAVDRLMAYARVQFAAEEALMVQVGLDARHVALHRRQHEQFIHNLRDIWGRRDQLPDLPSRMMGFLASWVGLHVLGTDPAMVRQMAQVQAGVLPSVAHDHAERSPGSDQPLRAVLNMVGVLFQDLSANTQALAEAQLELASAEQRLRSMAHQLEHQARHDALLQVASQRYFEQRLDEEVARAFRREEALAVMVIDLDHFSDHAPHMALPLVDACLQAVTEVVVQAMKRTTDLVARHGAHRLAVLMPETDRQGAAQAARRVVERVQQLAYPHPASAVAERVTVSVGIASWVPRSRTDGHMLLREALAAQNFARFQGGNRLSLA